MCQNGKFVRNRYNHKLVFVKCGKCPACLQEKADRRAQRIRNTVTSEYDVLMVNLDYDNKYVPYILRSDLEHFANGDTYRLPIYRDTFCRYEKEFLFELVDKIRGKGTKKVHIKDSNGKNAFFYKLVEHPNNFVGPADLVFRHDFKNGVSSSMFKNFSFPDINSHNSNDRNKIGVIYYKDAQRFVKRLRKHFKNKSNGKNFKYFVCSEYGERNKRPHFHFIFFIPKGFDELFRDSVRFCWPYTNWDIRPEFKIKSGTTGLASYVSSYVNSLSSLPQIFRRSPFSLSWHYSHVFGFGPVLFQFMEIKKMYMARDLRYIRRVTRNGVPTDLFLPLPYYVINRYFPKFKGFNSFNLVDFTRFVRGCFRTQWDDIKWIGFCNRCFRLQYDFKHAGIRTMIINKFLYLHVNFGLSLDEFCEMYYNIWIIRASNQLRMFHDDDFLNRDYQYYNWKEYEKAGWPINHFMDFHHPKISDPNDFPREVARHNYLSDRYLERYKHGIVNATIFDDCDNV